MSATSTSDPLHQAAHNAAPSAASSAAQKAALSAALNRLSGLRWLAAVHLYVFHLRAVHGASRQSAEPPPISIPLFDLLPAWLDRACERGYCATSLFFLLSGFTLRWLYVQPGGRLAVEPRRFWQARFTRLFPLHLALLILIAPLMIVFASGLKSTTFFGAEVSKPLYLAIGFLLSATLTQAWFPEYALSWNFPTWALSNVAFFYAVFPWTVRALQRWSPAVKRRSLWMLPLVSLLPPAIYLGIAGEDRQMMFDGVEFWKQFGNELVMRNPLFWWPHFVLGMLLAEFTSSAERTVATGKAPFRWISLGDASVVVLVAVLMAPEWLWSDLLGLPPHWLRLMLRHGLVAPLYLAIVADLAAGRGLFARLFEWRPLAKLGDASFSLFMWQLPMIALSPLWKWLAERLLKPTGFEEPTHDMLVAIVSFALLLLATTGVALASAAAERKVTRRLRT
jgi:peptidoglycan/LPS O-acetylase OafA/YrhL